MTSFVLPYGHSSLRCEIPVGYQPEPLSLAPVAAHPAPTEAVEAALNNLLGGTSWSAWAGARSAAVAINDKSRPVPHAHLLPPLLQRLEGLGLSPDRIHLLVATGAHPPMKRGELGAILPREIVQRYRVISHDADAGSDLRYLGETTRGTPVWINRRYLQADLRLVVGNIEPHQFQGFSGGVKSAAIGLAGRATIDHNHALMRHPQARLGHFDDNPARQDVEEIGRLLGVHLALNAILNEQKELVSALAGEPLAVMRAGIPQARSLCQVAVAAPFDLLIASAGGHPKDINLYQAQKALAHAALVTRPGGRVILIAACPEGSGSPHYERWASETASHEEALQRFAQEPFRVGPHKAYLIARDASRVHLFVYSQMDPATAHRLHLTPVSSLQETIDALLPRLGPAARVGIMPRASTTIPLLREE